MRLSLRLLGLDLIDIEITTDTDSSDEPDDEPAPRSFGFHASGPGLIERTDHRPRHLRQEPILLIPAGSVLMTCPSCGDELAVGVIAGPAEVAADGSWSVPISAARSDILAHRCGGS